MSMCSSIADFFRSLYTKRGAFFDETGQYAGVYRNGFFFLTYPGDDGEEKMVMFNLADDASKFMEAHKADNTVSPEAFGAYNQDEIQNVADYLGVDNDEEDDETEYSDVEEDYE